MQPQVRVAHISRGPVSLSDRDEPHRSLSSKADVTALGSHAGRSVTRLAISTLAEAEPVKEHIERDACPVDRCDAVAPRRLCHHPNLPTISRPSALPCGSIAGVDTCASTRGAMDD